MEKPTSLGDLVFLLNTKEIPNGICTEHRIRATAQVESFFNGLHTDANALVCCAEDCIGYAFSRTRDQAADLINKGQLGVYEEKNWD